MNRNLPYRSQCTCKCHTEEIIHCFPCCQPDPGNYPDLKPMYGEYTYLTDEDFKKGFEEMFDKAWKELGGPDDTPIGEVSPGVYCIGKGVYTGIGGWNMFCEALDRAIKKQIHE